MGMLKEGVRLDRVRGGRQKYRRCSEVPYPVQTVLPKKPTLEDIKILASLKTCEPETPSAVSPDTGSTLLQNAEPDMRVLTVLSDLYDREIVTTISWAKQVPGKLK